MPRKAKFPAAHPAGARALLNLALIAGGLFIGSAAHAQITFSFDYSTNAAGVGFNDPVSGASRKATLEEAASRFSAMFGTHFTNTANIVMRATSTDEPLGPFGGSLASAGTRSRESPASARAR